MLETHASFPPPQNRASIGRRLRAFTSVARLNRAHRNAAVYLGASVLSKGASLFLIPVYTAKLSRVDYATFGLFQTLIWILPPLFTGALSAALARFFFDHRERAERDAAIGSVAWAIIAASVGAAVLSEPLLRLAPPGATLGPLDLSLLRMTIWTCAFTAIGDIASSYLRASEWAGRYAVLSLTTFTVTITTSYFLVAVKDWGLVGLLWGALAGQGVSAAASIGVSWARFPRRIDWPTLKAGLAYSVPLIPHVVANSLLLAVDRWALDFYGLRDQLGLYTLAMQLTVPISMAAAAWGEASSPRLLAAWRDGGYPAAKKVLPSVVVGYLVCGGGALLAVLLATPLLRLLINKSFDSALVLVPWLGGALVIGSLFSAFVNVLFLEKKTRIIPVLTLASLAVCLGLSLSLIPILGIAGAIVAIAAALATRTGLMMFMALRTLRRKIGSARTAESGV